VTRILLPLLALVVGLYTATPAWASTPRDELRNRVEELLAIAEDRSLSVEERAAHARNVVATMFDFSTTARHAFGAYWRRLTGTQRDEATGLMAGFLTECLVARVSQAPRRSTDRMRQRLVFGTQSVSGQRATVSLTLTAGRDDLPITADMVRRGSRGRPARRRSQPGGQLSRAVRPPHARRELRRRPRAASHQARRIASRRDVASSDLQGGAARLTGTSNGCMVKIH